MILPSCKYGLALYYESQMKEGDCEYLFGCGAGLTDKKPWFGMSKFCSTTALRVVRVAMYFRSTFVESCNQIHFWKAETSLKTKTNVSI